METQPSIAWGHAAPPLPNLFIYHLTSNDIHIGAFVSWLLTLKSPQDPSSHTRNEFGTDLNPVKNADQVLEAPNICGQSLEREHWMVFILLTGTQIMLFWIAFAGVVYRVIVITSAVLVEPITLLPYIQSLCFHNAPAILWKLSTNSRCLLDAAVSQVFPNDESSHSSKAEELIRQRNYHELEVMPPNRSTKAEKLVRWLRFLLIDYVASQSIHGWASGLCFISCRLIMDNETPFCQQLLHLKNKRLIRIPLAKTVRLSKLKGMGKAV